VPQNDWVESWNYDVLEDAWPRCVNYLFAPATHMAATMSRACYEFSKGKSTVVLVQEPLVCRPFDEMVTRKLATMYVVGRPIFKPFKTTTSKNYVLYYFLTPSTYIHVVTRRSVKLSHREIDPTFADNKDNERGQWELNKYTLAVAMLWKGANMAQVYRVVKGKDYCRDMLKSIIAQQVIERGEEYPGIPIE